MNFKVGDIVFLRKDSEYLDPKGSSENNPFNVPGIVVNIDIKDEYGLPISVEWQYPEWHEKHIFVTNKLNNNSYKVNDLELLEDKKLSDYYDDIIKLAKKRFWFTNKILNTGSNIFYKSGDNMKIHLLALDKANELISTNKVTTIKCQQYISEVINFHFKYGKGEIKFL